MAQIASKTGIKLDIGHKVEGCWIADQHLLETKKSSGKYIYIFFFHKSNISTYEHTTFVPITFTEKNVNFTSNTSLSLNVSSGGSGETREEYIANMMNIIIRPILIVFGTLGKQNDFFLSCCC